MDEFGALATAFIPRLRRYARALTGDTLLRTMCYAPDDPPPYERTAKEIKARLRATTAATKTIFNGAVGPIEWAPEPESE